MEMLSNRWITLRHTLENNHQQRNSKSQENHMSSNPGNNDPVTSTTSAVWNNHIPVPDTPAGFTVRTTYPTNPDGAEVMLEQWAAGSAEPPHSHPGDDMTVVVEGKMAVQFFTRAGDALVAEGEPLVLNQGDTGYIRAGRIHDASYLEDCKLVYVHDGAFGFSAEE
jgi:quercetin dioxygenase-like cupin family protein